MYLDIEGVCGEAQRVAAMREERWAHTVTVKGEYSRDNLSQYTHFEENSNTCTDVKFKQSPISSQKCLVQTKLERACCLHWR